MLWKSLIMKTVKLFWKISNAFGKKSLENRTKMVKNYQYI